MLFRICGQAGAISGWHMDNLAPYTAVTLHQNDEQKTEVLKLWCVVDLGRLTAVERIAALEDFAEHGMLWQPNPEWIRVIPLVAGDCLVMPPGCIHAPITVTNCLFTGAMFWSQHTFVSHTLPNWVYISKYRNSVTNEDPAYQTGDILEWIKSEIRADPDSWNVQNGQLENVIKQCDLIKENCKPCNCSVEIALDNCPCQANNVLCFKYCMCKAGKEQSLKQRKKTIQRKSSTEEQAKQGTQNQGKVGRKQVASQHPEQPGTSSKRRKVFAAQENPEGARRSSRRRDETL